jgi:flavin reductase (DIM6/NTAB) family NADH-FMN oxidoreductase RutF
MATWDLREKMNMTSAPLARGDSEFQHAGLETAPCVLVGAPRVAASPCALECRVTQVVRLTDMDGNVTDRNLVLGQVIGMHVDERYLKDGIRITRRLIACSPSSARKARATRKAAGRLYCRGKLRAGHMPARKQF